MARATLRGALVRQPSTFVSSRSPLLRLSAGRRRPALQQLLPLAAAPARTGVGRRLSSTGSPHGADKGPLEADTNTSWGGNLRGLGHNNYLGKILNARVYEVAVETPLQPAPRLWSKVSPWKRPSSAPVPPQGAGPLGAPPLPQVPELAASNSRAFHRR